MSDETFRWQLVDDFVSAINQHRKANFEPSGMICVDESMVRWYGLGGSWISVGLPHYVAMDRKPEDGCEIQSACCTGSGIICQIKLCKSKSECERAAQAQDNEPANDATAAHTTDNGKSSKSAGTSAVLELTRPWHSTNRIVVADSAFASVNTAVQLNKRRLGFIGVVKTATKRFPMEPLQDTVLPSRGQYTGMATSVDNATLMAYVWSDRDRRYFIATAGSMVQGQLYQRIRWTRSATRKASALPSALSSPSPCRARLNSTLKGVA